MDIRTNENNRTNFLIFVADQIQSFSLGCNGNKVVKTKNIDRLAAEGHNFRRGYCNNPVCMPSRSTMLTGLTPRQHGCLTNGNKLPEDIPTVTAALKKAGYRTHAAGKLHLQPTNPQLIIDGKKPFSWEDHHRCELGEITSLPQGYYGFESTDWVGGHADCYGDYLRWLEDEYPVQKEKYKKRNISGSGNAKGEFKNLCWELDIPAELHYNNWIADRCMDFLDSLNDDENFFLWCSFPDPHFPFASCKPYSEMYNPEEVDINVTWYESKDMLPQLEKIREIRSGVTGFNEQQLRKIVAQTYGMITHVDDNIGRVMDYLEKKGLSENTVIVFMADHGEYLGSHNLVAHKADWPWEEQLRIPFIWKTPHMKEKGKSRDDVVSMLDFVPTILEYAGIDEKEMDTRGFYHADPLGLPGRSLKKHFDTGQQMEARPAIVEYDDDWIPGKMCRMRTIIESRYKLTVYPLEKNGILVDLEEDPSELVNLWNDERYAGIKGELIVKLLYELARTDRFEQTRISGA